MATLCDAVTDSLTRLGDVENAIWSRDELILYYKDGYDTFARRTKCFFDIFVIENLPRVGNWQTDLEKYIGDRRAGWGLTDERIQFSGEHERSQSVGSKGQVAGTRSGPMAGTSPSERDYFDDGGLRGTSTTSTIPTLVPGGPIPQSVVSIVRVTYDNKTLAGVTSQRMRELDPNYETRGGEPAWFIYDKDGLYWVRVVPAASGTASYDDVDGSWGILTQRLDADDDVEDTIADTGSGGWGLLSWRDDSFPSGGPWGLFTRSHPDRANIKVECFRLGRDLDSYPIELPLAYEKYPIYWAMYRALERTGPGQDLQLAEHFKQRFEIGVKRLEKKSRDMDKERAGRLGGIGYQAPFGLGAPIGPYPYGRPY